MSRLSRLGAIAAVSFSLAPLALAASADPGESPGMVLLRNGIAGSANTVEKPPAIDIKVGPLSAALRKTTLADVTKALGGSVQTMKDGATDFAWVCLASPQGDESPATLVWFASDEASKGSQLLTGVATEYAPATIPAGCTTLKAPIEVETGAPGLSESQADISAALNGGAEGNVEPDGLSAWMFGAEPVGDGINVRETELKFKVENGRVVATSVRVIYEME